MRRRASSSNDSMLSESSFSATNSPLVQCAPMTWNNVPGAPPEAVQQTSSNSNNSSVIVNQPREVLETTV